MVRSLFFSTWPPWQAYIGCSDSWQFEKRWELSVRWHHGKVGATDKTRLGGRVDVAKRNIDRLGPLRLKVMRTGQNRHCFELTGLRKGGVLVQYGRKLGRRSSRVKPMVIVCMAGEADELNSRPEELKSEGDEKIMSIKSAVDEGDGSKDKSEALNVPELQPSGSRRGWLEQLKLAAGGLLGFWPMVPVQEEFLDIPKEPPRESIVWEGWGTSLCWWANFVGGLPEVDVDYVLDLIFDQRKGLGFNIARYNIGGGADLKFDTNMRPFADLPGFKLSADGDYDWSADERQRKVLLGAKARGANLFEAFSNSPPRWMTFSGSVTGNWSKGQDNLKPEHFAAFASYLTEVVHHYDKEWNLQFDYLAPFNEPVEGFWNLDRKKAAQEGCNFSVSSINKLIPEVKKALSRKGLSTKISAADSWSMNVAKVVRGLRDEAMDAVSQINVHTYIPFVQREGDAKRPEVKRIVSGLGKKLWMSEYGPLNWGGKELDIALAVGRHITLDINELQASAWCYWQVLEIPGKNLYWGLLHAEFKYLSERVDPFSVQIKKQYYVMMHFSRWIRPGFTVYASEGRYRDWLVMAVDPSTNATAVLVLTNTSDRNKDVSLDVSGIAPELSGKAVQATMFRTAETENHKELATISFESPVVMVRLVAKSITTMIVSKADSTLEQKI